MITFSTYESTVNSFYLAFYGRPAEPAGLKFWSTQLAANNGDMGAIVDFFAASEEAQVRFGTETVADRITDIYSHLFNRKPDAAGLAFWTKAIESGHATEADIAISIQGGALGSDATLSALRQQAADAFTAQVEASGSQYAGYAAIEAARILVRAVTADTTAADLDALVNATVSFADTATKTPKVVEAIAVNTTLLALFDTARGLKEPVALAKALADTAKAAAGDPVTLESLLRGGGMDKVLKVMPASATLVDVVEALATGGLPAAVEVVYPTTPVIPDVPVVPVVPKPVFGLDLSFKTVTHDKLDLVDDNVTNVRTVDVTFQNKGSALTAGQHVEYTIDGKNWIDTNIDTSKPNTIVLRGIDLVREPSFSPDTSGSSMTTFGGYQDTITTITLRAVDASGVKSSAFVQNIVYDDYAFAPTISLKEDTAGERFGSDHDGVTSNPALVVTGKEQGATLKYQVLSQQVQNGDQILKNTISTSIDDLTLWTDKAELKQGENIVRVRQIDAAGNISGYDQITVTLDSIAPSKPVIALVSDTGTLANDGVTMSGVVKVTGLEMTANTSWEYSVDGGVKWTFGGVNNLTGEDQFDLAKDDAADGIRNVVVRQVDRAGNLGAKSDTLVVNLDTTAPSHGIGFFGVTGAEAAGVKVTTAEKADVMFDYTGPLEAGSTVEWRVDGGKWDTLAADNVDAGFITIKDLDLTKADPKVEVRVVDAAGNEGEIAGVNIDGPYAKAKGLTVTPSAIGGLTVNSPFEGTLYLSKAGHDVQVYGNVFPGQMLAGPNEIGAQPNVASGTFKVVGASGTAIDLSNSVYTLGTSGSNEELEGDYIFGFGGADELTGNAGNNYLDGGASGDTITGNGGGDRIFATNGDSLYYYQASDSNLASGLYNASGDMTREQMYKVQSYDTVTIEDGSTVTFRFDELQHDVTRVYNPGGILPAGLQGDALFTALTTSYQQASFSMYAAVLFEVEDNTQLLVVNNGDSVIDATDLVIEIIGSGAIGYANGNVVYSSVTIDP